jgi:leader peptidase (prepilin peptidase)/N-methyltransferase
VTLFWWIMIPVLGGFTASFWCVVLERGGIRNADGRSVCVCGVQIPMYRNIPVVSWALQRGRAACCGARIPAWYWVAEVVTVAAATIGMIIAGPLAGAAGIGLALAGVTWWFRSRDSR